MPSFSSYLLHAPKKMRIVAILWTLLIFVACLIPGDEIPEVQVPLADKWVHFIIFGGFSFFWLCTFKRAVAKTGIIMLFVAIALGYLVELLQGSGITTGRSYDLYDVLADGIGGLLGVLFFFMLKRYRKRTP